MRHGSGRFGHMPLVRATDLISQTVHLRVGIDQRAGEGRVRLASAARPRTEIDIGEGSTIRTT